MRKGEIMKRKKRSLCFHMGMLVLVLVLVMVIEGKLLGQRQKRKREEKKALKGMLTKATNSLTKKEKNEKEKKEKDEDEEKKENIKIKLFLDLFLRMAFVGPLPFLLLYIRLLGVLLRLP